MTFTQVLGAMWLLLAAATVTYGRSIQSIDNAQNRNRTERHMDCNEDEYPIRGICCQQCPAGTHVYSHCTVSHQRGSCISCTAGKDFTGFPNGLDQCISCHKCRADQVLAKECTVKADAECQCKDGFFCIPGEPCEACTRCSRCPEGQRIKDQCTATRNTVCEDIPITETTLSSPHVITQKEARTDSPDRQTALPADHDKTTNGIDYKKVIDPDGGDHKMETGKEFVWIPLLASVSAITIFLVIFYIAKYQKGEKPGTGSEMSLVPSSTTPSADASKHSTPLIDRSVPQIPEESPEEARLLGPVNPDTVVITVSNTQAAPCQQEASNDPDPAEDDVEESDECSGICQTCGQAFVCDCQWTAFCYKVVDSISPTLIKRMVRLLGLSEATIDQIILDNPNRSQEQGYKFMQRWREQAGKQAKIGSVHQVLHDIGVGGTIDNIINELHWKIYIGPCS